METMSTQKKKNERHDDNIVDYSWHYTDSNWCHVTTFPTDEIIVTVSVDGRDKTKIKEE